MSTLRCHALLLLLLLLLLLGLAGCASGPTWRDAGLTPEQARERTQRLLPPAVTQDRAGWAVDIVAAFSALELEPSVENLCAVIAVTDQESNFNADPVVPGLSDIAWREIDSRAAALHLPKRVVRGMLGITSQDGRSYAERIDAARTERELSETFEDLISAVPAGERLLADRNPVRTGGPMQVAIAYAEEHAERRPYPYVAERSIRREVFTRRGGMYFGIAHLLDYPAPYEHPRYRFADFNAGHYASRNAAFQSALSQVSGIPLDLDGDLIRYGSDEAGSTERAARVLAKRLDLGENQIRAQLEQGREEDFADTALYQRVFARADETRNTPAPRAVVPTIALKSPKITRKLTTAWFASRVETRWQACMARAPADPTP